MRPTIVLSVTAVLSVAALARPLARVDQAAGPEPAALVVTLLGTGNPRPSIDRFGPSILVEAGTRRILVDAGRGNTQRLFAIDQRTTMTAIELVLLTHLHSDNVVGLPDLWLTSWLFGRQRPLAVRGPSGTAALCSHLEAAFSADLAFRSRDEGLAPGAAQLDARDVEPGVVYEQDGLRVTAFAVDHGGGIEPAYGYRVDYRGRSVAFSGDTRYFEPLVEHARGVDVLVHEVISPEAELRHAQVQGPRAIERVIAHHATPEQVGTIFSRVRPRLAVYSHIVPSPATAEDLVGPTRRTYDGPLQVGYDLMTIAIGSTIDVYPRATTHEK